MSDPNNYTVGWICALATEYVAARAVLDDTHEGPDSVAEHDNNDYTLGRIGNNNIVIAVLPHGEYGLSSAASVARDMLSSFPNVRIGLMVGIGGGAPSRKHDIRLGDVVDIQGQEFKETGFLDQPPSIVRTAVNGLMAKYESDGQELEKAVNDILTRKPRLRGKYSRPDPETDRLYKSEVLHPLNDNDLGCEISCGNNSSVLIIRNERSEEEDNPAIHYGRIASANRLMKNALARDEFAVKKDILCFEMEAAGLMNHFPCLVIRGICDYSDSHKNKEWQGYAAMIASVYAKDLLGRLSQTRVEATTKISNILQDQHYLLQPCYASEEVMIDSISKFANNTKTDAILDHQKAQENNALLDRITKVDYGAKQSDFMSRRQAGTGQWLLESTQFRTWITNKGQTLFCPGIPGAGKTILTAIVIDEMISRRADDVGIGYVYCNFRRHAEQTAHGLLSSLLKQLSQHLPSIPKVVQSLYETHNKEKTRPSLDGIISALQSVSMMYKKVYIMVDALNECEGSGLCRIKFLAELFKLQCHCSANIFVTSRPLEDITSFFADSSRLPIAATKEDIGENLKGHFGELRSCVKSNHLLQEAIKKEISEAVDGMFLLAEIFLQSLKDKVTENSIRGALKEIQKMKEESGDDKSKLLSKAYDEAMERINSQQQGLRDLAHRILSWITCTRRQLTISEMQDALATKIGNSSLDPEDMMHIEDMVSVCAGLVTIDRESHIVRLAHYTTQQYFNDRSHNLFPNIDSEIAEVCVTYLSFMLSDSEYAEECGATALWYASRNGHEEVVRLLLAEQNINPVSRDINFATTPLWCASGNGHDKVVVLLLDKKTDINEHCDHLDGDGSTPLLRAVCWGHGAMFSLLVADDRVNPDFRDKDGWSPLLQAARREEKRMVETLLTLEDVDVNARDYHYDCTPLQWAVREGKEEVVKVLLADKRVKGNPTSALTPLALAVDRGYVTIVELLLASGRADPNDQGEDGQTVLTMAAKKGNTAIVKVLLAAGASLSKASTAFFYAAVYGHVEAAQLLLKIDDVDVNCRQGFGYSPLHIAAFHGYVAVAKWLLENNADTKTVNDEGQTPMALAVESGNEEIIRLLRDHEASTEAGSTIN
ncbi:purine and uridine phosphorylase [Fusarium beomiforme]|uniref:Purine and uridine phosphorylase n=1 Tax=Fusarium beomiforme TaxID=44412 RepID=A0A9P5A9H3_9HYPO|nr:purine and uridine phosphorylase [Fusarium beomiforme]